MSDTKTEFINISKWEKREFIHTGGSRDKYISTSAEGEKFFFKKSLNKPKKDYKYEFWSEVIAYQVGIMLGFNVVRYDVAYDNNEVGCISKSIHDVNRQELTEGYGYIVEKYPDFEEKENYKKTHSFQKIIRALHGYKLQHCIEDVIKMIIFDTIIGNTDRHSANWAIVVTNKHVREVLEQWDKQPWYNRKKLKRVLWQNINLLLSTKGKFTFSKVYRLAYKGLYKFSPLYDNGSSLGRELTEERIDLLTSNDIEFEKYIKTGKPDIRWNDKHLNHFELVKTIQIDHNNFVEAIIKTVASKYSKKTIEDIINNIDTEMPKELASYKIPQKRKEFIIKYLDARINTLIGNNEHI